MNDDGVSVHPCPSGRLRDAYPVHEHDVEIRVSDDITGESLTATLKRRAGALLSESGRRKVVFAAPSGDIERIKAAEAADFRHVVDVEVREGEFSLMVAEPNWVTAVDMDLDRVPGS